MRAPDELFVFVNQVRAEAYLTYKHTRTFTSRFAGFLQTEEGRQELDAGRVDPFPFVPNPSQFSFMSPFTVSAINDYRIEWDAEQARRLHFPKHPSRLSAVFAFEDEATCREVSRRYGWPLDTVRRFRINEDLAHRAVRVNMQVVSLMRTVYPLAMWDAAALDGIWRHYWGSGENLDIEVPILHHGQAWEKISSGAIWEWLIDGQLVSQDDTPAFA